MNQQKTEQPAPSYQDLEDEVQRLRAQAALPSGEEWLRLLLESAGEGVFAMDSNAICTLINSAGVRLLGYRHAAELVGRNIHELIHHTRSDGAACPVTECPIVEAINDDRGVHRDDEWFWRADGTAFAVEYRSHPILRGGLAIGAVVTFSDVTERHRTEQALRESEERYRLVADYTYDWEYWVGPDRELRYMSPSCRRVTGHSVDEFLADPGLLEAIVHPEDRPDVKRHLREGFEAPQATTLQFRIVTTQGKTRWIEHVCQPAFGADGRFMGRRASNRDVTDRVEAEAALRRSGDFAESLIDNARAIVLVLDPQGRILRYNRFMEQLTGVRLEEVQGQDWFTTFLPERDREWIRAVFAGATSGVRTEGNVNPIVTRRGEERVIEWWGSRLTDAEGRSAGVLSIGHDITERLRSEEALRQSKDLLRLITDAVPALISYVDADCRYRFANDTYRRWFGEERARIQGSHVREMLGEAAWEKVRPYMARALAGEQVSYEQELPYREAGPRWVHVTYTPDRDESGRVHGFVVLVNDIGPAKRAEQALQAALAQAEEGRRILEAMMEHIPLGITIADAPDVRIRAVSRYGRELIGGTREQVEGITVQQHAERWRVFRADGVTPAGNDELPLTRATRQGELIREEEWILSRLDGTKILIVCTAAPIRDTQGQIIGGVIGWQDITERRAAEEQLRFQAQVLTQISDAVIAIDHAQRVTYWNRAAERMYDLRADEVLGQALTDAYRYLWWEPQAALSETGAWRGENVHVTRSGRELAVESVVSTLHDEHAVPVGLLAVSRDISERRRMERLKSELVSVVSHELRTPLTSIVGALGLLRGGVAGALSPQMQQLVEIAYRNSERLTLLVNDILDIDRLDSGRMPFNLQPTDPMALAEEALATTRPYAEQLGVALALEGALPGVKVNVDPDRLLQVLANLLSNAAKFSPRGATVSVSVIPCERGIRVAVTDSGPGIPDSFRERIFQKFAQADATDTRAKGGTGLGLSISKAIIERLGGRIGFDTEEGKGSTFWFELPQCDDGE